MPEELVLASSTRSPTADSWHEGSEGSGTDSALVSFAALVLTPRFTKAECYRLVGFEGESDAASLALLSRALTTGSIDDIRAAGTANMVERDAGRVRYYIYSTTDAETLAWAARRFAQRGSQGEAKGSKGEVLHHEGIFQEIMGDGGKSSRAWLKFGDTAGGSSHPSTPRLTTSLVTRLISILKDLICRGDGETLLRFASLTDKNWGENSFALPVLRALTWAARVLGERCVRGDFQEDIDMNPSLNAAFRVAYPSYPESSNVTLALMTPRGARPSMQQAIAGDGGWPPPSSPPSPPPPAAMPPPPIAAMPPARQYIHVRSDSARRYLEGLAQRD